MIHGEHCVARISPEAAHAAKTQRPWDRKVAREVINFLARNVTTEFAITEQVKLALKDLEVCMIDIISILENGTIWGQPIKTTREEYYKYTVMGDCLNTEGAQLEITVVPDHLNASLCIFKVRLLRGEND